MNQKLENSKPLTTQELGNRKQQRNNELETSKLESVNK